MEEKDLILRHIDDNSMRLLKEVFQIMDNLEVKGRKNIVLLGTGMGHLEDVGKQISDWEASQKSDKHGEKKDE